MEDAILPRLLQYLNSVSKYEDPRGKGSGSSSQIALTTCDFGGLNGTHLGNPTLCRLELSNCPDLITCVAWDSDIVVAFKNELNIANFK